LAAFDTHNPIGILDTDLVTGAMGFLELTALFLTPQCLELLCVLPSFHLPTDWSKKYLHKKCLNVNEGIAYKKV
jgi:hypothetical protein